MTAVKMGLDEAVAVAMAILEKAGATAILLGVVKPTSETTHSYATRVQGNIQMLASLELTLRDGVENQLRFKPVAPPAALPPPAAPEKVVQ